MTALSQFEVEGLGVNVTEIEAVTMTVTATVTATVIMTVTARSSRKSSDELSAGVANAVASANARDLRIGRADAPVVLCSLAR